MTNYLKDKLIIGISSRALFDLEKENNIFTSRGVEAYQKYQIEHEDVPLEKGTAFHLIESLLKLNSTAKKKDLIEVVIMSKNSPDIGSAICIPITSNTYKPSDTLEIIS